MKNLFYIFLTVATLLVMGCTGVAEKQILESETKVQRIIEGETMQLSAVAYYNDGTTLDMTTDAHWSVSDTRIATIDDRGLLKALSEGNATVHAQVDHVLSVTMTIIVSPLPDTTKPVITLLGDNPVTLTVGDTYTDAGATAQDDRDGDITAAISVDSAVDTNIEGNYTVSYNVSDAAGNIADTVTRTVIVADAPDTTKPVITLAGDNNVTLTVCDTYTDAGATAQDDRDGNITNAIVVTSGVDAATAGTYAVIYTVEDAAGNAADPVTRTVIVAAIETVSETFTIDLTQVPEYEVNGSKEDRFLSVANYLRGSCIRCNDSQGRVGPAKKELLWSDTLNVAAQEHSDDMLATSTLSRDGSGTGTDITGQTFTPSRPSTPVERIKNAGYKDRLSEELVVYLEGSLTLSSTAWVTAFENLIKSDSGHCSNIMNPEYDDFSMAESLGEAEITSKDGTTSVVEVGYWTLDFATH